jgi:hypothetical protein
MKPAIRIFAEVMAVFVVVVALHRLYFQPEAGKVPTVDEQGTVVADVDPVKAAEHMQVRGNTASVQEKSESGHTLDGWVVFFTHKYGITFTLTAEIDGTRRIEHDLSRLSPEKAIPELFRGYDFFLHYAVDANKTSVLTQVYVFLPGARRGEKPFAHRLRPESGEEENRPFTDQFHQALDRSPEEAEQLIVSVLAEDDENTRNQAVRLAAEEGGTLSLSLYEKVLAEDPSEIVRASAFDAIIMRSEAEGIDLQSLVEAGLNDPSPLIQERAHALQEALTPPTDSDPPADEGDSPQSGTTSQ